MVLVEGSLVKLPVKSLQIMLKISLVESLGVAQDESMDRRLRKDESLEEQLEAPLDELLEASLAISLEWSMRN